MMFLLITILTNIPFHRVLRYEYTKSADGELKVPVTSLLAVHEKHW